MIKLGFDNYISVETGYLLFPTPDEIFQKIPGIYNRASMAIYFASKICSKPEKTGINQDGFREAYIRAALNEFFSLEEYINKKYGKEIDPQVFKVYKTSDPILHMLRLLRNYNIHIGASNLSPKSIRVKTMVDLSKEFDIEVGYISNLNLDALKEVRSAKEYSETQLLKMIDCFDQEQHELGISTLIIKAVFEYLEKVRFMVEQND